MKKLPLAYQIGTYLPITFLCNTRDSSDSSDTSDKKCFFFLQKKHFPLKKTYTEKLKIWQKSKTQNGGKNQNLKMWQNFKFYKNKKNQNVKKLQKLNCDITQNVSTQIILIWQNSKTKMWQN